MAKGKSLLFFLLLHSHQLSFSKTATLYSLLLGYLLEGSNTLLSISSCIPPKRKSLFSLLVSRSIFSLPIRRTLGPKPKPKAINFFVALSIYKILFLFPLGLGIQCLFNKDSIPSWIMNTLPL